MLMQMALIVAERSTCTRLGVGAVVARDSRVISTGYNGPPSGMDHCDHSPTDSACERSVHAELNALIFAARNGVRTEGCILYVTHMPCYKCAQAIINSGIKEVVYWNSYRLRDGLELLEEAGVQVRMI